MVQLVVFVNLFFVPLLPLYVIYKKKQQPLVPNMDLLFQYGIVAVCNIPLTKIFIFSIRVIVGKSIPIDSGYYTVVAFLPTILMVLLYKFYKTAPDCDFLAKKTIQVEIEEVRDSIKLSKYDIYAMVGLFLAVFLITALPVLNVNATTVRDEGGTLANAAFLSGRNWYSAVVSMGGYYYKYGMAFLWAIPFLALKDSLMILHAIGVINAACIAVTPVIAYYIVRRYLNVKNVGYAIVMAAVSTVIPDVILQSVFFRGDLFLTIMNWTCALLMLVALHSKSEKKKILFSILLSLASVYAYACHGRGIVTVIAVFMTVILIRVFMKENCVNWPAYLGGLAGFLLVDRGFQVCFMNAIWQGGAIHNTGISFLGNIKRLFSPQGIKNFIRAAVGWVYNSFIPTGGLICVAFVACIVLYVHILKKSGKVSRDEGVLSIFGGLIYVGSLTLGLIFFTKYIASVFSGKATSRIDRIAYDRYICCTFGILCLIGIYILFFRKDLFGKRSRIASVLGSVLLLAVFAVNVAPQFNGRLFTLRHVNVLGYFLPIRGASVINYKDDNASTRLILIGVMILGVLLLLLYLSAKQKLYLFGVVSVCLSIVFYGFCVKYTSLNASKKVENKMKAVSEQVEEFGDLYNEYPDIYYTLNDGNAMECQVRLMDYHLMGKRYASLEEMDNGLVIYQSLPDEGDLSDGPYYLIVGAEYDKNDQDVLLVKGYDLKEELESRGYSLTLYADVL